MSKTMRDLELPTMNRFLSSMPLPLTGSSGGTETDPIPAEIKAGVRRVDHVAIVVRDIDAAIALWEGAYGLKCTHKERVEEQRVDAAMFPVGDTRIEFISPFDPECGVAKYLDKRGEGIHHICLEVGDIDAMLAALKAAGRPLIDEVAKGGVHNTRVAFVHPKGSNGVLLELVEKR
jgi:methylmalonyl-CoA/ethylmalonyl-CoA epimerase